MAEKCKIILIGESGVGKTCIIVRFIHGYFKENAVSTTGANYASKEVEFKEYKRTLEYTLWDTAGQEKYRGLAKIFYKDADIAILVYDICNKKSFEEIKNYWHQQLKEHCSTNISKIILFKFIFL